MDRPRRNARSAVDHRCGERMLQATADMAAASAGCDVSAATRARRCTSIVGMSMATGQTS